VIDPKEIDAKVDQETKKISLTNWAILMMAIGMLWAEYERLGKPNAAGLASLALALSHIDEDLVFGRRKPSGALAAVEGISGILPFGRRERELLKLSTANAGLYLKQISDDTKLKIRNVLIDSHITGMGPKQLETRLRETFAGVDRDWRKVAVTESAAIATNAYMLKQDEGQLIVVQSAVDCCEQCRSMLHGRVFTVLHEEPTDNKLFETCMWEGKNNIGRTRHQKSKDGKTRPVGQLWTPCIPLHPQCRCAPVQFDPKNFEIGKDGYLRLKGKS
jgi:hypothetical protein